MISESTHKAGKLLVFLEGETDPMYMRAAAIALGRLEISDNVEFEWIGAKDVGGQGYHTGKDSMNTALNFLKANPELVKRNVLFLFDNDVNKKSERYLTIHVKSMHTNSANSVVESGIENLLSESCIENIFFDEKTTKKKGGGSTTTRTLNKMKLCKHLCDHPESNNFEQFNIIFDGIKSILVKN
jgi:hypothetical protein